MNVASIERASAVALSGLDGMTPVRMRLLLRRHDACEALAVVRGDVTDDCFNELLGEKSDEWFRSWRRVLERCDPAECVARCVNGGVGVVLHGEASYPACLADDPEAPSVLFHLGDLDVLEARRVGVVGTRGATNTGRRVAADLGARLAERGVQVVSGLARGIDACAHRGAIASVDGPGPIGVVASGLDVIYPPEHRDLWRVVGARGLLLSERPPGSAPIAMAFPWRNRILAALSEVVVVVESRVTGGSLLTAREAIKRDITVMAVPGSLSSRASEGTNGLLREGVAAPVMDADDVLVALGLDTRRASRRRFDPRPALDRTERGLLELIGGDAVTLEELTLRSGRDLVGVAMSLGRMEAAGWVARSGGWFEALPPGRGA